jgi:glycosyltransferase involved in cell wall biosynthesis
VLTVAKFDHRKGIEWLLRAFARIADRETLLVVAGSGPEEEARRYREVAAALGIERRVVLTGEVAYRDVGVLMNRAVVFVLPAYHEPFGLVVLEALACGCRVIATDQAGPPRFVPRELRDGGDAVLVPGLSAITPPADEGERLVADLAGAIDERLARPLSAADRGRIADTVKHLTWDAYTRRLGRLYQGLASGG